MQKPRTCHPERSGAESKDLERKCWKTIGKDAKTGRLDPSTRLRIMKGAIATGNRLLEDSLRSASRSG